MFAEAFGIILLILLIVITWRVVDSIMQAPGTSPALPYVSTPPTVVPAGTPSVTASAVPGASSAPSTLPPVVVPPPPSMTDLQSSMGLSGLSMPTVDMSKYYPTSLAGTPAPTVPAATPGVTPPVVSAPAPLVTAPAVEPVVPAPTPTPIPVTQPKCELPLGPAGACGWLREYPGFDIKDEQCVSQSVDAATCSKIKATPRAVQRLTTGHW